MKKQLLAAAVAATMASVASADISITGAAKVNYTSTDFDDSSTEDKNSVKHEMDLKVLGKSGDTSVVINFGDIDATTSGTVDSGMNIEDAYVSTTVMGASLKAGQWDNGNNALRASSRVDNKVSISKEFSGVTVTYDANDEGNGGTNMSDTWKLSTTIGGVKVAYKDTHTGEDISLSTSIGGINMSYLALNKDAANKDRSVVEVSGSMNGVGIKVAQANADSGDAIDGDTWMGDFEGASGAYALSNGQDVTSIELSTSMAGNTVKFRHTDIDGVAGQDTDFQKIIVTRPLANGTTFEATYTSLNDDGSTTTDSESLDLELAVKF